MQNKIRLKKRILACVLIMTLSVGTVLPVGATESDMDLGVFDSWTDENRDSAIATLETTDWNAIAESLILDGKVKSGMQNKGLSKKVQKLEKMVNQVLKECYSRTESRSTRYTPLILAMIQVMSKGNPSKTDPCCVNQYFSKTAVIPDAPTSIRFLFNRIQVMEVAYSSYQKKEVSIKKSSDALNVVIEAVMLRTDYAKTAKKYHKKGAQKYYEINKASVFDPLGVVPIIDFADQVNQYITMVDTNYSTSITWSGTITPSMQKVCDAARNGKSTKPATAGYCAAWVSGVYQYALGYYPSGHAISYWTKWSSSGSRDSGNIPPGAAVVGTGSGTVYGHVGIYIGNGQVADNIGGVNISSLEKWIAWQSRKPSAISGEKGWIGWVWPKKKDLSKM